MLLVLGPVFLILNWNQWLDGRCPSQFMRLLKIRPDICLILSDINELSAGEALVSGQELRSPNRNYKLMFQNDGNLVLYQGINIMWWTTTWRESTPPYRLAFYSTWVTFFDLKVEFNFLNCLELTQIFGSKTDSLQRHPVNPVRLIVQIFLSFTIWLALKIFDPCIIRSHCTG